MSYMGTRAACGRQLSGLSDIHGLGADEPSFFDKLQMGIGAGVKKLVATVTGPTDPTADKPAPKPESSGGLFGLSTPVLVGAAVLGGIVLYSMKKKG